MALSIELVGLGWGLLKEESQTLRDRGSLERWFPKGELRGWLPK